MFVTLIIALMLSGVDVPACCAWILFIINTVLSFAKIVQKNK